MCLLKCTCVHPQQPVFVICQVLNNQVQAVTHINKGDSMPIEFIKRVWTDKTASLWIVLIRFAIGIEWFMSGLGKLRNPANVSGMAGTLTYFASGNQNAWYVNLTNNLFIPNAEVFAWLVSLGELLVGITLILGIFINFSALVSVFLNLNFYFAAGWISPAIKTVNWIMMILALILVLSPGSKSLSIDRLLADKFPPLQRLLIDWFGFSKRSAK